MEDKEIKAVRACQQGDLSEFACLYDKYIKKIYDFVYYKTGHKETAEDIVSQVFFKAMAKIGSFRCDEGSFQAWLYQIARNTVIDHYRTQKYAENIDDQWSLPAAGDIERDLEAKIRLEAVDRQLRSLKPEQREIIILRVWQELSYQEIAQIIGKSEAGCKMAFSRAIKALRQAMPAEACLLLLFLGKGLLPFR